MPLIGPWQQPAEAGRTSFADERRRMVAEQLRARGISDERVLAAMSEVPREEFVPPEYRDRAYGDYALPIEHGQTISQPYTVAFMCEAAQLRGSERVLEIGTGSGYAAAVLSRIVREVYSVERVTLLCRRARERLARLGCTNVRVYESDGTLGFHSEAPFDAILVTAGAKELPAAYADEIVEGGRIVIPLGPAQHAQTMTRLTRRGDELVREELGPFAFVPLVGEHGWSEEESR